MITFKLLLQFPLKIIFIPRIFSVVYRTNNMEVWMKHELEEFIKRYPVLTSVNQKNLVLNLKRNSHICIFCAPIKYSDKSSIHKETKC